VIHSFADDALGTDDAVGLADRLARGEVSSLELVDAAIARTERVADSLGALAVADFERARQVAGEQDAARPSGVFAGLPTFVKDNVAVAGLPIGNGCDAYVGRPSRADGELARTLRATGMVFLGKTQLSEFGFSASAEHARLGPVRNPWDPAYTAGASSSGSAALVAAGAVPLAHANDGGGSIRIPASVCGLVGLKPTRGRIPEDQLYRQMPVRIVADGVLTRSVRDTATFLGEAERIARNRSLPPVGTVRTPSARRLKVAVLTSSLRQEASEGVRRITDETAGLLADLGHHVEAIEQPLPEQFADDFLVFWASMAQVIMATGRAQHGSTWDAKKCDPLTRGLAAYSRRTAHRLPGVIRRLHRAKTMSAKAFAGYDVVLSPTLAHETPRLGHLDPSLGYDTVIQRLLEWVAFTPLANASGEPALSLPLGSDAQGLPVGMHFSAAWGEEALLLRLAYELEQARPWGRLGASN
jgi:amidase